MEGWNVPVPNVLTFWSANVPGNYPGYMAEEDWLYVYLLLEFQSTVDPYMAVRLMTYLGLLYQDLIRSKQLTATRHLPPVLLVVLYNGSQRWTAALHHSVRRQIPPPS